MKLGQKVGGSAHFAFRWAEIVERGLVPVYPGDAVVKPVRLPSPPLVDTSKSELAQAQQVAVAYREALKVLHGQCKLFQSVKGKEFLADKSYPVLVESLGFLVSMRIAPSAWVAYSWETWVHIRKRFKPRKASPGKTRKRVTWAPPVAWVFSSARTSERVRDWYSWRESTFMGGQLWFCQEHLDLINLYNKLMLRGIRASSDAEIKQAVREILPKSKYEDLRSRAEVKYELRSLVLAQKVARGEYIWR
jgi:hypothetical protein